MNDRFGSDITLVETGAGRKRFGGTQMGHKSNSDVLHSDVVYSHTGYDVTIYFRSEVIAKKIIVENTASDGFW